MTAEWIRVETTAGSLTDPQKELLKRAQGIQDKGMRLVILAALLQEHLGLCDLELNRLPAALNAIQDKLDLLHARGGNAG
jgi:hypothetical protein